MYTKYSKTTGQALSTLAKNDIGYLPFEEIEYDYQEILHKNLKVALDAYNTEQLRYHQLVCTNSGQDTPFEPHTILPDKIRKVIVGSSNLEAVTKFVEKYPIKTAWSWLGPQLIAYIAEYGMHEGYEPGNKISARRFLTECVGTHPRDLGLYRMLVKVPRGTLMSPQTAKENLVCCGLVPIYLTAHKKMGDIDYRDWDRDELHLIVESELCAAMLSPKLEKGVYAELLDIREAGLKYVSRAVKDKGSIKSHDPATYHQLVGIGDSGIGHLSRYARAMLTQIWCAHPTNRHKYMVLDPYNWDAVPDTLLGEDQQLFTAPAKRNRVVEDSDLPWEA